MLKAAHGRLKLSLPWAWEQGTFLEPCMHMLLDLSCAAEGPGAAILPEEMHAYVTEVCNVHLRVC